MSSGTPGSWMGGPEGCACSHVRACVRKIPVAPTGKLLGLASGLG